MGGRDIAGATALQLRQITALGLRHCCPRIVELNQAAGQILQAIAGQVERKRLVSASEPDRPAHVTALPIIDLALVDALMNAAGHSCSPESTDCPATGDVLQRQVAAFTNRNLGSEVEQE